MKTKIIKPHFNEVKTDELREVAGELLRGKIVSFPTDTVYGLGVSASSPEAVSRLYELKQRDRSKSFTYHIGNLDALERLNIIQSRAFRFLVNQFWPGPVTLIALNRKEEKIGLRLPKHPIALSLLEQCSELVLATSANRSGEAPAASAQDVLQAFQDQVDIVIDGGTCEWGQDSTVVDTVQMPPIIVRRGVYADRIDQTIRKIELGKFPRKKVLIVCTGNTCRSPMAEGRLRAELRRKGLDEQIEVGSCGIYAREGSLPTAEAILTLKNDEISIEGFRSHVCRRQDVIFADLILVMGEEHERFISTLYPPAKDRIITLGVEDPIGRPIESYQKCYESIREKISGVWPEVIK